MSLRMPTEQAGLPRTMALGGARHVDPPLFAPLRRTLLCTTPGRPLDLNKWYIYVIYLVK
jgi:hypothetical protein